MFMTLKGKITSVYVGLVILIGIVGCVGLLNLFRMEKDIDDLMTDNYKSINTASKMMEAIERQDGAMLMYISIDREKGLDLFNLKYADFIKYKEIENKNITEPGENKLAVALGQKYIEYVKLFSELQLVVHDKGQQAGVRLYEDSILPLLYEIKINLNDLSYLNEKAMFRSRDEAVAKARQSMILLLILSFTAVAGGFFLARYFINKFLGPLQRLTDGISKVSKGDLEQQLDVLSNDEAGKLAKEFNEMTHRLRNYEKSTLGFLMTEKNKSMAIVKSISDPLFVLDVNFRIMLVNDAAEGFFEVNESKAAGRHINEIINDHDVFEHIAKSVKSGEEHSEKIMHMIKETDYYFNIVVNVVKGMENKNMGFIIAFHNVTELKKLERVKTDFISTISHEFKTPLTSIMMAASMLSEEGMGELNSEQKEIVDTVKEDGERLSNLVNELLELSRIESGKAVYNIETCSINTIIETSIAGFMEMAERSQVALVNEIENDLPYIAADFGKIGWVMNNLLSNALKYSTSGDLITITSNNDAHFVYISVKDTGSGILPEYLDRIFDKFVQVKGRDIEARGTGLGLSVAREIIRAHGGDIWVKSELDTGSNFTFSLPVSSFKEEK